jgi:penicillin-binding protein 2
VKRFIDYRLMIVVVLVVLVGCSPAPKEQAQPLPTLASIEQPPSLDEAAATAITFLEDWRIGDFDSLYNTITFSAQESVTKDVFVASYTEAAEAMTLDSLTYTPGASLFRDPQRADIVNFSYNVTFNTRMLGSFDDTGRNMQLVYDKQANSWRVAWTPGDIFGLMASGGKLRIELSVPSRANIYDDKGRVMADQSGRMVSVQAVKQEITDWGACLNLLAPAMNKDPQIIQKIYDRSQSAWMMDLGIIEPAVYDQQHTQMEATCAAQFSSRPVRQYSNGTAAASIIGSVGYPDEADLPQIEAQGFNSDSILGKSGIEATWDETLRGHPGARLVIVSPGGDVLREVARVASTPPRSVWLTIDTELQLQVQQILATYYDRMKLADQSKGASAVIMDIHTGAILAMVSYPTYDVNAFAPFSSLGQAQAQATVAQLETDPRRPILNRPTQGAYPLGSVMKLATSMAVADSGVYTLDQPYVCTGIFTREGNFTRYDWLPGGHGHVTLPSAITQSCNPYFYEVGYQLNLVNPEILPGYQQRFFGQGTGMTDLAENPGFIPDPEWKIKNTGLQWTQSDAINIAIGQGEVQVTPLQVVRMISAIANGGTLYKPQIVAKAGILGEASSYTMTPNAIGDANIKPEVLEVVRKGMCDVTTKPYGTAEFQFKNDEALQQIGVCGKTGTAQDVPRPTHAWFAAYAPRENPEIAIVVMVENGGEGSGVAAPITRDILDYYFFQMKR